MALLCVSAKISILAEIIARYQAITSIKWQPLTTPKQNKDNNDNKVDKMSANRFEIKFGPSAAEKPPASATRLKTLLIVPSWQTECIPNLLKVERDTIARTLGSLTPDLSLSVELAGVSFPAVFSFDGISSFDPKAVAGQIDLINTLDSLRRQLKGANTAEEAIASLQQLLPPTATIQIAPEQSSAEPEQADFARLLDADVDTSSRGRESERVQSFIQKVLVQNPPDTNKDFTAFEGRIDLATHDIVRQVLKNREFRAIEQTWRGIEWLANNLDLDSTIEMWILPLDFANARSKLADDAVPVHQTEIFRTLQSAGSGAERHGFTAIMIDYNFQSRTDVQMLGKFGEMAELLDSTILAKAPDGIIDPESTLIAARPDSVAEQSLLDAWSAFQAHAASRRCAVALPRLLLRGPYGRKGEASGIDDFEELLAEPDHEDFLWGNPAYGLLLLICSRFEAESWDMNLNAHLDIDDMPVAIFNDGTGEDIKPPAEVFMSERDTAALQNTGVMAFLSYRHRNAIKLSAFHCVSA